MFVPYFQRTKRSSCRLVVIAAALTGLMAGLVWACDTPVYRYAMYSWEPAPYEVYFFHDKPLDEQATKVQKLIEAASRSEEKPANLFFVPVSLSADPELKKVPPDVRKAWQDQKERQLPTYMVVTPHGQRLYQGVLDETILKAMLESPARVEIAKQLAEGKAGVMVLLTGSDKAANDGAEKEAQALIADVAAGKVELYTPPPMSEMQEDRQKPAAPRLELGLVKVARSDAAEKWLVDSLLSLESDLTSAEFAAAPMIFAVLGRGRALPPFVGKGITRDNLLECVYFLTGACSCTVKDQNPGMDLLFATDWWSVAEKLASTFGAEEGNEGQLGSAQLFPQLMIPGGEVVAEAPSEAGGEPKETAKAKPAAEPKESVPAAASQDKPATEEHKPAPQTEGNLAGETQGPDAAKQQPQEQTGQAKEQPAEKPKEAPEPAAETPATEPGHTPPAAAPPHAAALHGEAAPTAHEASAIGVLAVGAGLAVALVLLFGVTFLVLRPK